ncbi:hypothetical protein HPULCUR_001691 [Helicostylum pulchrum]|uniref:Uncharacterized protein n=1 Tax=Helicostylum pulchrum TaxID=562976 RepID=A0ABP9XNE1_9FUNG
MTKDEFDDCCEDNVNIGALNPVMYTTKKRYDLLKKSINFAKLPFEAELLSEEKAAPFSPLTACAGCWGEKMLLIRICHRTSQYCIDEEGENRVAAQTILQQEEQEEQEEEWNFYQISLPLLLDPSLENPIVEGPLLEHAEGEAATKAIQRKRGRHSTKKKTTGIQI